MKIKILRHKNRRKFEELFILPHLNIKDSKNA